VNPLKLSFHTIVLWIAVTLSVVGFSDLTYAAKAGGPRAPRFTISGDADLTSHFIYRGLSYSDRDPALNAEFLLHMGSQFKFGIWGSNISNITNVDDNLWFKFVGEIRVDINQTNKLEFYLYDNHFYPSKERNGQNLGFRLLGSDKFVTTFELGNNFEASKANYEYLAFTYIYPLFTALKATGTLGFTNHRIGGKKSFFDFRGELLYEPIKSLSTYLALTFPSDFDQFGERGKFFILGGVRLHY
jgi:uncharacterized protein (TIGR02001 family)